MCFIATSSFLKKSCVRIIVFLDPFLPKLWGQKKEIS